MLARYGFYFDEKNKSIKCFECGFELTDLSHDSALAILHKHFKFRSNCSQVIAAQEFIAYDSNETDINNESIDDDKYILMEENERSKSERLCVICLSKDQSVQFFPCAHLAVCLYCNFNLQNCHVSNSKIRAFKTNQPDS